MVQIFTSPYRCDKSMEHMDCFLSNSINSLMEETMDSLTRSDFLVPIWRWDEELEEFDIYEKAGLKEVYMNAERTYRNIQYLNEGVPNEDVISLLLEGECYDKIIEVLLSEKASAQSKKRVLSLILGKYSDKLREILRTDSKLYKEKLQKIIKEVSDFPYENQTYVRKVIKREREEKFYEYSPNICLDIVKFFVENGLVDINKMTWECFLSEEESVSISSAAVSYIRGNANLMRYLYNLPTYKEQSPLLRENSNLVILQKLSYENGYALKSDLEFLFSLPNFEVTANMLRLVADEIAGFYSVESAVPTYPKEVLGFIINLFLRRTKKKNIRR